ncbi:hypothetical protein FGB62_61g191 [Gracilaria domingensis]|nr:hypothetical protein FGB62_61g191 [Gracilaria domingensis]
MRLVAKRPDKLDAVGSVVGHRKRANADIALTQRHGREGLAVGRRHAAAHVVDKLGPGAIPPMHVNVELKRVLQLVQVRDGNSVVPQSLRAIQLDVRVLNERAAREARAAELVKRADGADGQQHAGGQQARARAHGAEQGSGTAAPQPEETQRAPARRRPPRAGKESAALALRRPHAPQRRAACAKRLRARVLGGARARAPNTQLRGVTWQPASHGARHAIIFRTCPRCAC